MEDDHFVGYIAAGIRVKALLESLQEWYNCECLVRLSYRNISFEEPQHSQRC